MDRSKCNIKFKNGYIKEHNDCYTIKIEEKLLKANIIINRLLPPVILKTEKILQFDSGEYFAWNIPQPKGIAKGEILIKDKLIPINGIVYHDHNWGNLNIKKNLRGWIWTRVHFKNSMLILGELQKKLNQEKIHLIFFIDDNGNKHEIESYNIIFKTSDKRTMGKMDVPEEVKITFKSNDNYKICGKTINSIPMQEAPLSSFSNNGYNTLYSKIYYFLKLYLLPNFLKVYIKKLFYYQGIVNYTLFKNDRFIETKQGKLEFFHFDK